MCAAPQESRRAPPGSAPWELSASLAGLVPPPHASPLSGSPGAPSSVLTSGLHGSSTLGSGAQSGANPTGHPAAGAEPMAESDWLTLLLSKEPSHVKHQFGDEAPGMPWARAKFQVRAVAGPTTLLVWALL